VEWFDPGFATDDSSGYDLVAEEEPRGGRSKMPLPIEALDRTTFVVFFQKKVQRGTARWAPEACSETRERHEKDQKKCRTSRAASSKCAPHVPRRRRIVQIVAN
jgi:hypothetical protein